MLLTTNSIYLQRITACTSMYRIAYRQFDLKGKKSTNGRLVLKPGMEVGWGLTCTPKGELLSSLLGVSDGYITMEALDLALYPKGREENFQDFASVLVFKLSGPQWNCWCKKNRSIA